MCWHEHRCPPPPAERMVTQYDAQATMRGHGRFRTRAKHKAHKNDKSTPNFPPTRHTSFHNEIVSDRDLPFLLGFSNLCGARNSKLFERCQLYRELG
mmetsp:Transcript_350/g.650  ORF Transcript_350/g.650 Transcript_350/m.650 type:complete len:97 (+) Transcript_350:87-377(+)